MPQTRNKLSEAEFFLKKMRESQNKSPEFGYYLSAFLSAFRSVTALMQNEFKCRCKGLEKFENWYATQQEKMRLDGKMKLLKEMRDLTIHQQNTPLIADIHVDEVIPLNIIETSYVIEVAQDGSTRRIDPLPVPSPEAESSSSKDTSGDTNESSSSWRQWFFDKTREVAKIPRIDDILKIDVVTISQEGMALLERIVSECEQKFSV